MRLLFSIVTVAVALTLLRCAAPIEPVVITPVKQACTPMPTYSPEFQKALAAELRLLASDERFKTVETVIGDYHVVRKEIEACNKVN